MAMNHRTLRPLASGFNPKSISGLQLWLDPSDSATLGPTSSGTGSVSNNGVVKYLQDKSGNSRHAIQTGADSVSPTLLTSERNGKNALSLDGGDFLVGSLGLTLTSQTVFVVCRFSTGTSSFGRLFTQYRTSQIDTEANLHYIPLIRNGTNLQICSYQNAVRGAITIVNGDWNIFMSSHSGTEISNRVNNGTAATAGSLPWSLNLNAGEYSVGGGTLAATSSSNWRDRLAEVLMWDRVLTDTERNAVASYLGKKYSITVS